MERTIRPHNLTHLRLPLTLNRPARQYFLLMNPLTNTSDAIPKRLKKYITERNPPSFHGNDRMGGHYLLLVNTIFYSGNYNF